MKGRLEVRKWVQTRQAAYAVTTLAGGQYLGVGTEEGLEIFDLVGTQRLTYPSSSIPLPIQQLTASDCEDDAPSLVRLYAAARQGWLIRLDVKRSGSEGRLEYEMQLIYEMADDLYTLSLSGDGHLLAVGHRSPGLAVLDTNGGVLWRRHVADGNATQGQMWSVAFDSSGDGLYVGSAARSNNWLARLDPLTGLARAQVQLEAGERVGALATLPGQQGVAIALSGSATPGRVACYDPGLTGQTWERCFDEPVTALAADQSELLVAAGVGYGGEVVVLDAANGDVLAAPLTLMTLINGLSLTQARALAAATDDGHLVLLEYESGAFRL